MRHLAWSVFGFRRTRCCPGSVKSSNEPSEVSQAGQDDHDVKRLVTLAEEIEPELIPPLRNLHYMSFIEYEVLRDTLKGGVRLTLAA